MIKLDLKVTIKQPEKSGKYNFIEEGKLYDAIALNDKDQLFIIDGEGEMRSVSLYSARVVREDTTAQSGMVQLITELEEAKNANYVLTQTIADLKNENANAKEALNKPVVNTARKK